MQDFVSIAVLKKQGDFNVYYENFQEPNFQESNWVLLIMM